MTREEKIEKLREEGKISANCPPSAEKLAALLGEDPSTAEHIRKFGMIYEEIKQMPRELRPLCSECGKPWGNHFGARCPWY
jgi:hypothetical protein